MTRGIAAMLLLAAAVVSAIATSRGETAREPRAQGAVAPPPAQAFIAPNGSDAGPCTRTAPCATIGHVYRTARPGTIAEVAAGAYQGEEINGRRPGGLVTFRAAAGTRPSVTSELRFDGASNVEIVGLDLASYYVANSSNVTMRNVTTHMFFIRASSDVRLIGGAVHDSQTGLSPTIGGYDASTPSRNVLVDGVTFRDIGRALDPTGHVECLFVQESVGLTIRNSKFSRCDVMDVYVNPIVGGQVANLTVVNNVFDQPWPSGFYAIDMSPGPNLRIAYNSFSASLRLTEGTWTNARVTANVGRLNNCDSTGITYSFNVWTNRRCSPADRIAPTGFVDPARFDLRLKPRAAAIDRGNPKSYPARDIAGRKRPQGKRPDAGAYEVG